MVCMNLCVRSLDRDAAVTLYEEMVSRQTGYVGDMPANNWFCCGKRSVDAQSDLCLVSRTQSCQAEFGFVPWQLTCRASDAKIYSLTLLSVCSLTGFI